MAVEQALEWLRRRPSDPVVGWLNIDRIQQAFKQVYRDMAETGALADMVQVVLRRRVVRIIDFPVDSWVTVGHGLNTEDVLVQAYISGQSLPIRVRVISADVVSVLATEQPTGIVSVIVVG